MAEPKQITAVKCGEQNVNVFLAPATIAIAAKVIDTISWRGISLQSPIVDYRAPIWSGTGRGNERRRKGNTEREENTYTIYVYGIS